MVLAVQGERQTAKMLVLLVLILCSAQLLLPEVVLVLATQAMGQYLLKVTVVMEALEVAVVMVVMEVLETPQLHRHHKETTVGVQLKLVIVAVAVAVVLLLLVLLAQVVLGVMAGMEPQHQFRE